MLRGVLNILALQIGLGDSLQGQPLAAVALLFGAGVLTSLTPCIYPMIPITAGIITGSAGENPSRGRIVGLTLTYAAGLALLYSTAGLIAGLTGTLFGTIAASVWARLLIAILLAGFGFAMLGTLRVDVPSKLGAWAAGLEGGSYPGVFLLGASSGIVAAPCGAPAFAAVLTWVATTGSAFRGFAYLLAFSLGMTAILVMVGIFSGSIRLLPRAGRWMAWAKHGAGVVLLIMSAYYVYLAWLVL
jgi:thiol:disulfide interchange protein DsbD